MEMYELYFVRVNVEINVEKFQLIAYRARFSK